jgi:hypothetical protein
MMSYRCLIPSPAWIGDAAAAYVFSSPLMVERLRNKEQGRHKTALDDWENEGGRVAAADVAVPTQSVIDMGTGARFTRGDVHTGQSER